MSYPIQFFNLTCPRGGNFFVCEGYATEFIGCCMSNPCSDDARGKCPQQDVRASSFAKDKYSLLPAQDCVGATSDLWYTCSATDPPFFGCCRRNPCNGTHGSCSAADLVPAKLTTDTKPRQAFLTGGGTNKTAGANDTLAADPSPPPGLSTGAIAGIMAGVAIVGMAIVAIAVYRWGRRVGEKRARGDTGPQTPGLGYTMVSDGKAQPSPYQDSHHVGTPTLIAPYHLSSPKPSGLSHLEGYPSPETQYRFSSLTAGESGATTGSVYHQHSRQFSGGSPVPIIGGQEMAIRPPLEMDGSDGMRHELSAGNTEAGLSTHPSVLIPGGRSGRLAAGGSHVETSDEGGGAGLLASQDGNREGPGRQPEEAGDESRYSHPLGIR